MVELPPHHDLPNARVQPLPVLRTEHPADDFQRDGVVVSPFPLVHVPETTGFSWSSARVAANV